MAFQLDSNIPLLARGVDVAGSVQSGLQTRGMIDQLQQAKEQAPLRQQMLEQQAQAGQLVNEQNQQAASFADQNRVIGSIASSYAGVKGLADSGKFNEAADALEAKRQVLIQSGITNFEDTDAAIAAFRSDDAKQINAMKQQGDEAIRIATERGLFDKGITAEEKRFEGLIKNFSPEEKEKARRVKAGIDARAVGSAATTIAETGKTDIVAESQAKIKSSGAQAVEEGKAKGQSISAPLIAQTKAGIEEAVTLARDDAASRGEALTELQVANASMPSLISVVDELKELAPLVTSTIGGNVFNTMAKELGFGATEGSTAKAKFSSVINNQILPLLKQTFGAAFTKAEGDELKSTMGNVDAAPAEKIAQLNSFIDGKVREIQTKERQLGLSVTSPSDIATQDTGITVEEFRAMTPTQRAAALQQLGGSQ